ncbi:MAG: hypothetical protein B6I25_07260, partial [Planctomycetales bacterium 4572_13]
MIFTAKETTEAAEDTEKDMKNQCPQRLKQTPCLFVIQSCISLFFMRVFHAAIFVSPFISTAEADINAV